MAQSLCPIQLPANVPIAIFSTLLVSKPLRQASPLPHAADTAEEPKGMPHDAHQVRQRLQSKHADKLKRQAAVAAQQPLLAAEGKAMLSYQHGKEV